MTKLVTSDTNSSQSVSATGHPSQCKEPVPGSVEGSEPHNVTVKNANGTEKPLATYANADLHFDSHAHKHNSIQGCYDYKSHDIKKGSGNLNKDNWSPSISISPAGGSSTPVLEEKDNVGTDPITGKAVNATGTGVNDSLKQ